jgi:multiple sugar transport system permease protein
MAAYGLARYEFRGRDFLGMWILSNKMLPPIAIAVPIFSLFTLLKLVDTYSGLIWIYTAFNLPLAVWLLKPYIEDIPVELERAAAVDGCKHWMILWRIVLPLALPGILATALFCFVLTWNEYLFSLVLTGPDARTLPVMAAGIRTRRREIWGQVGAAGVMITLPALLFGIAIQKQLVRGLLPKGVKR